MSTDPVVDTALSQHQPQKLIPRSGEAAAQPPALPVPAPCAAPTTCPVGTPQERGHQGQRGQSRAWAQPTVPLPKFIFSPL